jgi:hypothetical protein
MSNKQRKSPYFIPEWRDPKSRHYGKLDILRRDNSENWPTWLTADAFAGWYHEQNRLRAMNGDDPLPDVPRSVAVELADAEEREGRARARVANDPSMWSLLSKVAARCAIRQDDGAAFEAERERLVSALVQQEMRG